MQSILHRKRQLSPNVKVINGFLDRFFLTDPFIKPFLDIFIRIQPLGSSERVDSIDGGRGRTSQCTPSKYNISALALKTYGQVLSCSRINLLCPLSHSGRFNFKARSNVLYLESITIVSGGFSRFQQLIIHKTLLISPDAQLHNIHNSRIRAFGVMVVDPLFITNDNLMQQTLPFLSLKRHRAHVQTSFNVYLFQFVWHLISFFFTIPVAGGRFPTVDLSTYNAFDNSSSFRHEPSFSKACNFASSNFFWSPPRSLSALALVDIRCSKYLRANGVFESTFL